MNTPASKNLMSETAIVAHIASATLGSAKVDWLGYAKDYSRVRDAIESVLDGFEQYNERIAHPGGFHLRVASRERDWQTHTGKANFIVHQIEEDTRYAARKSSTANA